MDPLFYVAHALLHMGMKTKLLDHIPFPGAPSAIQPSKNKRGATQGPKCSLSPEKLLADVSFLTVKVGVSEGGEYYTVFLYDRKTKTMYPQHTFHQVVFKNLGHLFKKKAPRPLRKLLGAILKSSQSQSTVHLNLTAPWEGGAN